MAVVHIAYEPGVLRLLDQRRLPSESVYVELRDWRSVADAIAAMIVRGAPAIGITAAYGMALAAREAATTADPLDSLSTAASGLSGARPTAVNLSWAVRRQLDLARENSDARAVIDALERNARAIHDEDIEACRRIGHAGAELIGPDATILTHCNTGSLATGGYGTALGVVRSAHRAGKLRRVLVDETRPQLQGARLTTWELAQDGIPHTLITDSMAAWFMRQGRVSAVVVGADRIAGNGDTANKIGTYGLALLARAHGVPFIVAAPLSTLDGTLAGGDAIPIEERDPDEVTHIGDVAIAPAGTIAANPAFDVTPAELITAIATERGLVRAPYATSIASVLSAGAAVAATRR